MDPSGTDPSSSYWYHWPGSSSSTNHPGNSELHSNSRPSPPSPNNSSNNSESNTSYCEEKVGSISSSVGNHPSPSATVVVVKSENLIHTTTAGSGRDNNNREKQLVNVVGQQGISSGSSSTVTLEESYQHLLGSQHHHRTGGDPLTTALAELSGELAMSLSPKAQHHHNSHTTPFSVTDILSPLEESFRISKACLDGSALASGGNLTHLNNSPTSSPYNNIINNNTRIPQLSPNSAGTMNVQSGSPYTHMHVPQLSHQAAAFQAQYCNGADLHGMTSHYGDVRSSATAGWYGASASDPRFASKFVQNALRYKDYSYISMIRSFMIFNYVIC